MCEQERASKLQNDETVKLQTELSLWERKLERERKQTEKFKVCIFAVFKHITSALCNAVLCMSVQTCLFSVDCMQLLEQAHITDDSTYVRTAAAVPPTLCMLHYLPLM
jgi:hypothetical protein